MKNLGLMKRFVGLDVSTDGYGDISVSQKRYLEKVLHCFGMETCKPAKVRHFLPTHSIFTRGITTLIIQIQRAIRLYTAKLLVLSIMQPSGHVQISHIPSPNFLGFSTIHQSCMLTQLSTCCATSRELSIFISSFQGRVINLPNL